jgi:hypothetical protein
MRAGLVLAILIGTTAAALADSSPVLVIPGRSGVPVIIRIPAKLTAPISG